MVKLTRTQHNILKIALRSPALQSSEAHRTLASGGEELSHVSVKRNLSQMVRLGVLHIQGGGRSTSYTVATLGRLFADINADEYANEEPDKRYGFENYNFRLFSEFPKEIFNPKEKNILDTATREYQKRLKKASPTIREKELERLIIELSWKSSKIEGNTYTLLDTEKLILGEKEAHGHSRGEAKMILNHKDAFTFVRENAEEYKTLTLSNIERLHAIIVKDLNVNTGLRNTLVGITGSKYKPLDNRYQIKEAVAQLSNITARSSDPYMKALLALAGISYIQPFEDGNKRTSRLAANAILLAYQCAPLSYRSVQEKDYRNGILVFYEINSIMPFKNIFIEQYLFGAKNYAA